MIILALAITGIVYFILPLIYVNANGKVNNKTAWKIAIINFIICHIAFIGIAVGVGMDGGSASTAPVLWLFLTQAYLHDKSKDGLIPQTKKESPKSLPKSNNKYQHKSSFTIKEKMMNINKNTINKWAIAGVIITAIVTFIFVISLSDAKKFGERDICESATTITTTGNNAFQYRSINKNYDVYVIATGSEYNFGKDKNTIYIIQKTNNGIKAYKAYNSYANKGNILNYFNTVNEVENLPTSLVAGELLAATIVVPILLGLATVGLWVWWYFLNKQDEESIAMARVNTAPKTTSITSPTPKTVLALLETDEEYPLERLFSEEKSSPTGYTQNALFTQTMFKVIDLRSDSLFNVVGKKEVNSYYKSAQETAELVIKKESKDIERIQLKSYSGFRFLVLDFGDIANAESKYIALVEENDEFEFSIFSLYKKASIINGEAKELFLLIQIFNDKTFIIHKTIMGSITSEEFINKIKDIFNKYNEENENEESHNDSYIEENETQDDDDDDNDNDEDYEDEVDYDEYKDEDTLDDEDDDQSDNNDDDDDGEIIARKNIKK